MPTNMNSECFWIAQFSVVENIKQKDFSIKLHGVDKLDTVACGKECLAHFI